ncbi:MAG: isoprenylcysteine carboxylmethyltransferase family protein [Proteobacteria bacterium]|nr:isoprenylcysteine carboxylmethyltransferase family protein [Pseudomonadota bacterium]
MHIINFRPPRIGMLFALVAVGVHWLPPVSGGFRVSFPVVGAVLAVAGFAIMMRAWWLFKKGDVAICPTAHTARLLTGGVYRFSRNPMYLGMVSMLLGLAAYVGTPPFYLAAAGYFAVLNFVFCPHEEAKLTGIFGQEFLNYKARVRRWL